jgi:hypothetical protein
MYPLHPPSWKSVTWPALMAQCITSWPQMIQKPILRAAGTSLIWQIWLILIGRFGSSLGTGRQIWREFSHIFGGSPHWKANMIISTKGSRASSSWIRDFQCLWWSPSGFELVLSLTNLNLSWSWELWVAYLLAWGCWGCSEPLLSQCLRCQHWKWWHQCWRCHLESVWMHYSILVVRGFL